MRPSIALATVLAAGLLVGARSLAQDGPGLEERVDRQAVVMLAPAHSRDTLGDLIRAVEGQLSDLDVAFRVEWLAEVPRELPAAIDVARDVGGAAVVFWFDLENAGEVYIYLAESERRRILVRRLDAADGSARFESLAVIVHEVVDAVLRGGKIGVELDEPPEREPVREPTLEEPSIAEPVRPERPVRLAVDLGYDIRTHSTRKPVVHGFALQLSATFDFGLAVFGGYVFQPPIEIAARRIEFNLRSHPISLGAGYLWTIARFRLGGAVALIWDYVVQETTGAESATAITKDNEDLVFSVAPMVVVEMTIVRPVALFLDAGVQIDATSVEYAATDESGSHVLVAPWRTRPLGRVGVQLFF